MKPISMEVKMKKAILRNPAQPHQQIKFGSLLSSIAREAGGLTVEEAGLFDYIRDKTPAKPMKFEWHNQRATPQDITLSGSCGA